MISDKIFDIKTKLRDIQGRDLRYSKFINGKLLCHKLNKNSQSVCETNILQIDPSKIKIKDLKKFQIWDKLSLQKQKFILNRKDINNSIMIEHTRGRKRKELYKDIPRTIICKGCGKEVNIIPSVLSKRLDLNYDITDVQKISDYILSFKCTSCVPRKRGRVRNKLYKDIPREVQCIKCKQKFKTNAKYIYSLTNGDKSVIINYIKNYKCRKCKK